MLYCGSIFTAVCALEVVALPIISGRLKPWRCISWPHEPFRPRRGDQPGEADDVALLGDGGLQDLFRRHHHAHVHHVVAVAAQYHADDVLADVMHVALDGRHEDLALGFRLVALFRLDEGDEVCHGLLHHAGGLDHLGRNILPAPNRSLTTFMPLISGPSITSMGVRTAGGTPRCPPR